MKGWGGENRAPQTAPGLQLQEDGSGKTAVVAELVSDFRAVHLKASNHWAPLLMGKQELS